MEEGSDSDKMGCDINQTWSLVAVNGYFSGDLPFRGPFLVSLEFEDLLPLFPGSLAQASIPPSLV